MFLVNDPAIRRGIDLLPATLISRLESRRGRAYAFDRLTAASTALVVIDMTNLFVEGNAEAQAAVRKINLLASGLRSAGGVVHWVRPAPFAHPTLAAEHLGRTPSARYTAAALDKNGHNALYPGFRVEPCDLHSSKSGYSAFFPGSCDAADHLRSRQIDTVLVAGIVTDVCCEASVRDAHSCGFRAILLADASVGSSESASMASFAAIHRNFGDVRLVAEVAELLACGQSRLPEAKLAV